MRLDGYLVGDETLRVERPPRLWEADTDVAPFRRLLGELLALGRSRSGGAEGLTLNVANVTVGATAAGPHLPAGDYVAVTVRGRGSWGPDAVWPLGGPRPGGPLAGLAALVRAARGRFAYTRDLGREGSVTVYFSRLG